MRKGTLLLTALCAALLIAVAAASASAGRLSMSNQNLRFTFTEFIMQTEGTTSDLCELTLEGSFHRRTFSKVLETLLGYITRATAGNCTLATTVLTATLPWHVRYGGFTGSLPNITSITLLVVGFSMNVGVFGFNCLTSEVVLLEARRNTSTGAISSVIAPAQPVATRSGGGFGCPAAIGEVGGIGSLSVLGTTTLVTVTLI